MRINARAVLVMPWLVLLALTMTTPAFRVFSLLDAGWARRVGRCGDERVRDVVATASRAARGKRVFGAAAAARRGDDGRRTDERRTAALRRLRRCPVRRDRGDVVRPRLVWLHACGRTRSLLAPASGRSADVLAVATPSAYVDRDTLVRLFGPPLVAVAKVLGRLVESGSDESLALRLRHAGHFDLTPDEYRVRQLASAAAFGGLGFLIGTLVLHTGRLALALGVCGLIVGADTMAGSHRRCDRRTLRTVARRALHREPTPRSPHPYGSRSGAGDAADRRSGNGRGCRGAVRSARVDPQRRGGGGCISSGGGTDAGTERGSYPPSLRSRRRTWCGSGRVAAAAQRGHPRRSSRGSSQERHASRAAMLIPTIAVLAPIMILFIAAPIPSIVFGTR